MLLLGIKLPVDYYFLWTSLGCRSIGTVPWSLIGLPPITRFITYSFKWDQEMGSTHFLSIFLNLPLAVRASATSACWIAMIRNWSWMDNSKQRLDHMGIRPLLETTMPKDGIHSINTALDSLRSSTKDLNRMWLLLIVSCLQSIKPWKSSRKIDFMNQLFRIIIYQPFERRKTYYFYTITLSTITS